MPTEASVLAELPGGPELIKWFGRVPTLHDAEVIDLRLNTKGASVLRLDAWLNKLPEDGSELLVKDRRAIVTFTISGIIDLFLDGFSTQNVLYGVEVRRAMTIAERRPYYSQDPRAEDWDLVLEPSWGMDGWFRCRELAVAVEPWAGEAL